MIIKANKNEIRKQRHSRARDRVKGGIKGTAEKPRLNVYRSSVNIYAQIIDDVLGKTLVSCSSIAKGLDVNGLNKTDAAKKVGLQLAEVAKNAGIETVVFDRGGYLYTGRVKALADGAREGGLKF